jgi:hypothetical protein
MARYSSSKSWSFVVIETRLYSPQLACVGGLFSAFGTRRHENVHIDAHLSFAVSPILEPLDMHWIVNYRCPVRRRQVQKPSLKQVRALGPDKMDYLVSSSWHYAKATLQRLISKISYSPHHEHTAQ